MILTNLRPFSANSRFEGMKMLNSMKPLFKIKIVITTTFILIACAAWPAHAKGKVQEAENLVADLITDLEKISTNLDMSDKKNRQVLDQLVEKYFDVDAIMRFSVGRYWRVATKSERSAYARLFRNVLLNQASEQFYKLIDLEFRPTTTKTKGSKLILVGGIIHDKTGEFPDVEIFWRIVAQPQMSPKIFDIEIENISMLKTQQDENTTLIRRNSGRFGALIEALQDQLDSQQTD